MKNIAIIAAMVASMAMSAQISNFNDAEYNGVSSEEIYNAEKINLKIEAVQSAKSILSHAKLLAYAMITNAGIFSLFTINYKIFSKTGYEQKRYIKNNTKTILSGSLNDEIIGSLKAGALVGAATYAFTLTFPALFALGKSIKNGVLNAWNAMNTPSAPQYKTRKIKPTVAVA
jgi:hypothetical protein